MNPVDEHAKAIVDLCHKYNYDILQAISELEVFCKDKDIDDSLEDRQLQLTAERELEIIGEALSRH